MNILALVDHDVVAADDPDFRGNNAELRATMEFQVISALRSNAHEVTVLPFGPDIRATIDALNEAKPPLVFNMTEHFGGDRRKDAHIAAMLELFQIPYTGTGPAGLMLCRDKAACKRVLGYHRIRVPRFVAIPPGKTHPRATVRYPSIVKPIYEDGSDGISLASIVRNDQELEDRVRMIHSRMKQPIICEEYVEGRELYVGVIGNQRLTAFPARELRFGNKDGDGPQIATSRVKWDKTYRKKWQISYEHAELPKKVMDRVGSVSRRIFDLLGLRDYGRIDLRLTAEDEIVFLEANPNPDLSSDDDLALAAAKADIDYPRLIDRVVHLAATRHASEAP